MKAAQALTVTLLLAAPVAARAAAAPPAPTATTATTATLPPLDLPRGQVVDKIACAGAPGETYALYLPSGYTPDRAWPILYVLDPRSRGALAAERFRPGAEAFGYILASSNNSMSDGPMDPNLKAIQALWTDTHARFRIDDRRVYGAGFSGTVRFSVILARSAPGAFAGVIGAGAGWPFDQPPRKGEGLVFYGTVGDKDFNYYEMIELEPKLAAAEVKHRVEIFDGIHQWPPAEIATRALAWLDLEAMKAGTIPKDAARIDAAWNETTGRAREYEKAGDLFQASRTWSGAAADFAGLRDTAEAGKKAAELAANPALQRELKDRAQRVKHDQEVLGQAPGILGAAVNPSGELRTVAQVVASLKIHELRKTAQSAPTADERLSAQRILNTLQVQTGYYLPQMYSERKQYDRAIFVLSIATEIDPKSPNPFYNRAAAQAKKGDRKRALADLRQAVDHGWKDRGVIDKDADFDGLRQDAEFKQLVQSLGGAAPAPGGNP
ncbi:MAG: tetratricopeptide repeat protein [Thermoanaerobaculia bacterium]